MAESNIAILIDSTANIPSKYLEKHNFHTMPLRVNWPGEEIESLKDLKEIKPDEFYERLKHSKEIPTTSQPSPGEFIELFSQIGQTSKDILAVLVSDKLSGTFKSAQFALNMVEDLNIELIDSKNGGMGQGLIALKAAEAVQQGKPLAEVAKLTREYVEMAKSWFVVENLEFLHKGGRVSGTKKLIGTILDMKPLLHIVDGGPEVFGTVRNLNKAVKTMLDIVEVEVKNKKNLWIGISHAANPEMAAHAEVEIRKRFDPALLITNDFSPVFGVHVGPGAIGIAHLGED